MSECTHDCSTCSANCSSRQNPQDLREAPHAGSHIKKVIGVVSGKGGVGKSMVTAMLAVRLAHMGKKVGILDADITGPSIPKALGIHSRALADGDSLLPVTSRDGIKVMSLNLLVENETDPVVWRGPVIAGAVKQFWTDVVWGELDVLLVDMPPGTGDVPLTVFQSLPVDGIVIVTSPQQLVGMIVEKAVNMADMMGIPILGLVENYSYFVCNECNKKHYIFGEGDVESLAKRLNIPASAALPIEPAVAKAGDEGLLEGFEQDWLDSIINNFNA